MPKKRRNGGRNRHGRGITRLVDCSHCMCKPAKDKAIGRFAVRNMVDSGALNDLKAACVYSSASGRLARRGVGAGRAVGRVTLAPRAYTPPPLPFPPPSAYTLPKLYNKNYYCISCAVHSRIVRVRNVHARRVREPPVRFRKTAAPGGAGGVKAA